jgi:hypothetical protein
MRRLSSLFLAPLLLGAACAGEIDSADPAGPGEDRLSELSRESICELPTSPAEAHGRKVWFENTYGGEKFFYFLSVHPDPAKRIRIGFDEMVKTPRAQRFVEWGVLNDPDCVANPAGGADICPDANATGVVGIRKFPGPGGTTLYGSTCASCHAGFDPLHPPADPAEPKWVNIHPTIGNQYAKFSKIFSLNLAPTDPRRFMFLGWPDGAVDTTALFNDNIMNPGVVTAFWDHKFRPDFEVGRPKQQPRNGQGGEDDLGGDIAALRVYTNIGACFQECVAPRADRPDPAAPIDVAQCKRDCPDFPPDGDIADLVTFLGSVRAPKYPGVPLNFVKYARGYGAFKQNCASCHVDRGEGAKVLSNDQVNAFDAQSTNKCRALSTNWDAGKVWAQFSSNVYKSRGFKGYRTMPLSGIWTTSPYTHTQSIGLYAAADASPQERAAVYEVSMYELLSATRTPKINTLPVALGPFPAGTPLTYVYSRDPATGALLCDDAVENRGHTYGSGLSGSDKAALIYWLKYQ